MSNYVTLPFNKKLNLLRDHCFDDGYWDNLDHQKWCLHCGKSFNGHATRVRQDDKGRFWLECGTPGCSGSPIDWAEYPWWDEKHPMTRAYLKKNKTRARKSASRRRSGRTKVDDDDIPF